MTSTTTATPSASQPNRTDTPPAPSGTGGTGRLVGLGLSALLGIYLLVLGGFSIGDTQTLLTLALFGFGIAELLLSWRTHHGSRAAWAFLIAVNGALAVAYLFGAPTLRNLGGISLGLAMFPAGLHAIATAALSTARRAFK